MIAVLVPTRGRPGNLASLIESWRETTGQKAYLIVCVDDDDPELENYRDVWKNAGGWDIGEMREGPRLRLGGTLNHYAPMIAPHYEVIGFMGDDHRPRTKDWDLVIDQIHTSTPLSVTYGDDLLQGMALATACFLDSKIVSTLGYMVFPGGIHLFFDNFWMDLGRSLGTLAYIPSVVIEHVHPAAGKTDWDERYVEVNDSKVWDHDELLYKEYVAYSLPAAIAALKQPQ